MVLLTCCCWRNPCCWRISCCNCWGVSTCCCSNCCICAGVSCWWKADWSTAAAAAAAPGGCPLARAFAFSMAAKLARFSTLFSDFCKKEKKRWKYAIRYMPTENLKINKSYYTWFHFEFRHNVMLTRVICLYAKHWYSFCASSDIMSKVIVKQTNNSWSNSKDKITCLFFPIT